MTSPPSPPKRRRRRIVVAVAVFVVDLFSTLCVAQVGKSDAPMAGPTEYRRPELLCAAWSKDQVPGKKPTPPDFAWRPDGSVLSKEELSSLVESTKGFDLPLVDPATQLRPLHLVFRIDERAKWKQIIMPGIRIGDRTYAGGFAMDSLDNHLAVSSISALTSDLAEWPAQIDIEVRTPIAEPELLLRLDDIPKGKVDVDKGVSWSFEENIAFVVGEPARPAAVLRWDGKRNPLLEHIAIPTLKSGRKLQRTLSHPNFEVSRPLNPEDPIVSVEFWRRRYRLDRYEKVPTNRDKMPK